MAHGLGTARDGGFLAMQKIPLGRSTLGHWCGKIGSNVTITSEYIFRQAPGLDIEADSDDVLTTTGGYVGLKLGMSSDAPLVQRVKQFALKADGVAKCLNCPSSSSRCPQTMRSTYAGIFLRQRVSFRSTTSYWMSQSVLQSEPLNLAEVDEKVCVTPLSPTGGVWDDDEMDSSVMAEVDAKFQQ
ncbi:uncharacterized protein N7459_009577 [Penicillium hispanicum]|uniref:uncharacterized protein n=1 Tax=Penicillium hispanicum TaxID=1080232 RepID=UPI0025408BA3|nr:uncharacterized protein N7459_009577 [Penicillium hispanicum]KAJ5570147.1 hypothetical protein N7459_009577 [Penicillium hispanicum]